MRVLNMCSDVTEVRKFSADQDGREVLSAEAVAISEILLWRYAQVRHSTGLD